MAVARKKIRRRRVDSGRATVPRKKTSAATESALHRRLEDLTDRIDIVLPEVTARVAALEHLLLQLNVCSHKDLRQARAFVKEQEE